ncbi:ZPR1 zinc finger domain-containing protein [Picrophilus oshimae]|uniref:C4-type Zn-finger-containing protein n=1 Tax=Picrophilus torridus (strain ATCC 700027 / DSM 9790 / JCM 10055 / NBRC 100828 / KAW 2/3) TaxID=1122961 RepID=Q6L1S2_PICTO|nr:ZPR1 zinc finger domain-containing protein [Picrophilus oshimae]AAT43080.1 C4-type Zn-finger-containing protein [Picrophilus oshimae DSM 9789]SMD30613.1 zinc finger protein [Picrophilus oshimae DSM 9789]
MDEITEVICPVCGKNLYYTGSQVNIPYEGNIIIETYFCKSCGYHNSYTNTLEEPKGHKRLKLKIRNREDLKTIVYRSSKADIIIPEIDAEITHASNTTGYITTVEGIIYRIKDHLDLMGDGEEINYLHQRIDGILNGPEEEVTLILDDVSGLSRINSSKVEIEEVAGDQ